ncbi:MAG: 50S ribosomal protein L3 [Bacillota bacterium]|nr:50S ribosomal protein L3 [Bacillota bacterium]MDI7250436.1 50S ribosomal protein L3 [Bacillota bacterium]
MKGILGRKLGMTQVFDEAGRAVPVTVVKAGPCVVVQKRTPARDGYSAIQLGFEEVKEGRLNRPRRGHLARAGVRPVRFLRELRVPDAEAYQVGQDLRVDLFKPGDRVDVTGISKGKGFAGGVKRWGFGRGPMAHGSKYHRGTGSLATGGRMSGGGGRVFPGRKMPGHLGAERVTVQNLRVERVDPEHDLLLLRGAVPGPRGGLVIVRSAVKG